MPAYKAHRDEMPDDLRSQFALVRKILATYEIPIVEIDGQEADDVIATLARIGRAARRSERSSSPAISTCSQIVDDTTTVLTTRRGITDLGRYDEAAVRARFELEPQQLPDYRGLKGDPSDNLPGIPGVGEKTAIKLIKAAGSLDALLAESDARGYAETRSAGRANTARQARVCRDVSIIARDLPIDAPLGSRAHTRRRPTTSSTRSTASSSSNRCWRSSSTPETSCPLSSAEMLRGTIRPFVAATDPPDFEQLAAMLGEPQRANASPSPLTATRSGSVRRTEAVFRF